MWALQRGISNWKISKTRRSNIQLMVAFCCDWIAFWAVGSYTIVRQLSVVKGLSHCFFEFSFSHVDMQDRCRKSIREQHSERQVSWTPLASVYLPILSTAKQCVTCKTIMPTSWLSSNAFRNLLGAVKLLTAIALSILFFPKPGPSRVWDTAFEKEPRLREGALAARLPILLSLHPLTNIPQRGAAASNPGARMERHAYCMGLIEAFLFVRPQEDLKFAHMSYTAAKPAEG